MLCSPIVSNMVVTKTLIDGGAGLNVLSVETFNNLQVPYSQLQPTIAFLWSHRRLHGPDWAGPPPCHLRGMRQLPH